MCNQCEVLYVNGVKCHEIGCPDAWKDYDVECPWCGTLFRPKEKGQDFCEPSCYANFYGLFCHETKEY